MIFIKIKFLFNLVKCLGGSFSFENLVPLPPTRTTAQNGLVCNFIKISVSYIILIVNYVTKINLLI